MHMPGHTFIAGVGSSLPTQRVASNDLLHEVRSTRFGIPEEYISTELGIEERRVAQTETQPSDLAANASISAMQKAGVSPEDIDIIIFCGIEGDFKEPATAHNVQAKLGAYNAVCFDTSNACQGFLTGVSTADALIFAGSAETALICTAEKPSHTMFGFMKPMRETNQHGEFMKLVGSLTVGDAGGAMVIQRKPVDSQKGILHFNYTSDGKYAKLCYYKDDGGRIEGQMDMRRICGRVIGLHKKLMPQTYELLGWTPESVDMLVCHQAGKLPHKKLAAIAGQPVSKAPITYAKYANLATATFPVAMDEHPKPSGTNVMFMGAGSGVTSCQIGAVL
jgi:3-oxoacyl-(acyl-carrier-protein) synthase III